MREFLEKQGCQVEQGIFLPERLAAARAGVVTYGKNCFAFSHDSGSFIVLSSFVVDVGLDREQKHPMTCTVRQSAPPASMPVHQGDLRTVEDEPAALRRIQHLLGPGRRFRIIELYPARDQGEDGILGPWLRHLPGGVPQKSAQAEGKAPPDPFLEKVAQDFDLTKLLSMPEDFYRTRVQRLMYNYLREKKYFQRNAIAMGNSGDQMYLPALARALQDPEALVRGTAAWAIGRR